MEGAAALRVRVRVRDRCASPGRETSLRSASPLPVLAKEGSFNSSSLASAQSDEMSIC